MAGVILRIVSSRAPYRRAGVNFEPTGHKTIVATEVALADLDATRLDALLLDPHLDVSAGVGMAFVPGLAAADIFALADAAAPIDEPPSRRNTLQVIADHHRIELERGRDAAAPGGDDEGTGDKQPLIVFAEAGGQVADALTRAIAGVSIAGDTISTDANGVAPVLADAPTGGSGPDEAPSQTAAEGGSSGTSAATPPPAPTVFERMMDAAEKTKAATPPATSLAPPSAPKRARRQPTQK